LVHKPFHWRETVTRGDLLPAGPVSIYYAPTARGLQAPERPKPGGSPPQRSAARPANRQAYQYPTRRPAEQTTAHRSRVASAATAWLPSIKMHETGAHQLPERLIPAKVQGLMGRFILHSFFEDNE